jgi:2,3-bisphosphoglycerate-dependent phosphoglycerate mutase
MDEPKISNREDEERERSVQTVYLIRHCRAAAGGGANAPLTEEGEWQAQALAEWFRERGVRVGRIISSPLLRAVQSAAPLAQWAGVPVETDERLRERVLAVPPVSDWREPTIASFADPDLCLPGGESGRQAADRVLAVLEEALKQGKTDAPFVLVTHGQPLAQLLGRFDPAFGFEEWLALTNPDLYCLRFAPRTAPRPERVWQT